MHQKNRGVTINPIKILFLVGFFFLQEALPLRAEVTLETIWGPYTLHNPVIEKLLNHPLLIRLKKIQQLGPLFYFNEAPAFSRYDHSVGVLVLLSKAKVSEKEQIAGLFHDVSHTAFSHIGDHLFDQKNDDVSYQDSIHLDFLRAHHINEMIQDIMTIDEMNPDRPEYKALERHHPELCADRIQYILHEAVLRNILTKQQARKIVDNLTFDGEVWFFTDPHLAKMFALASIHLTKYSWGSPYNMIFYQCFTRLLKRAVSLQVLTLEAIQKGSDEDIMNLLTKSSDPLLQEQLATLKNLRNHFSIGSTNSQKETHPRNIQPKCRAVDPLIKTIHGLQRLSRIDPLFQKSFLNIKKWCEDGYAVTLVNASCFEKG